MPHHFLFDVSGRTALVTGAAGGLGFAMAECLAENGANVGLADQNADAVEAATRILRDRGYCVTAVPTDVAEIAQIEQAADMIVGAYGGLDIVFANAGISAGPGPFTEVGQIEAVDPDRWRAVLDVNLTGVFSTLQVAARHMKPRRSGRIVVTASTAGFRADPMVGYAYAATKAAVANLVRQAAIDLARFDIRVNGIAPGPFRTQIGNGRMNDQAIREAFAESLPLGRIGDPEEIKGVTLLLASDASSFMTGAVVPVDGGALAW